MGKSSKKVMKKQKQLKVSGQQMVIDELKGKIAACKEEGKYEAALEDVIELLQMNCHDIDVIFDAAELYFMAGDYQRSAVWINNTLDMDPQHLGARILLTRICMLEDKAEDGLAIMDFVLKTGESRLTEEQKDQVEEILEYYRYTSNEQDLKKYHPNVAGFLGIVDQSINNDMREKISIETPIEQNPQTDTDLSFGDNINKKQSVNLVEKEIKEKDISIKEKITLCNSFAGAYYYENDFESAQNMLKLALSYDSVDDETLHNLILLALEQNDVQEALQYAAKMRKTDFSLLKMIRENS